MMVNTNSKLFLEILEQKGDDLYFNPDEFKNTNVKKKLTQLQSEIKIPPIWAELSADDITALKKLKEEAKWLRALAYTEYEEDKPEKKLFQRKSKYEEKLDKHHEEKNKLMAIAESLDNRVDTMLFRLEIQSKANRTSTDANWNLLLDGRPMKYNDLKNTPELQSWYDRFRKNALEGASALSWGDWKVSNAWLQWLVWWWALKAWYPEKNAKNLSNAASRALWIGIAYLRWTKTDGFRQKLAVGWVLFAALSKDYGDGRRMLNFGLDDSVINIDDLKMLWKSSNPDYSSPELTKRTSELQNEANQFKPLMRLFKDKNKLKEYLKNNWNNTSLDIKKLIENYGLNNKSNYANLDKTEWTSISAEKKTDWYDISDFNKDDPAIQALLVQLVHIYNTSQQDIYNTSLDEFLKEIWVNSEEKVTELIEGTISIEWLVNSKRASIEKDMKDKRDAEIITLQSTIPKGWKIIPWKEEEAITIYINNKEAWSNLPTDEKLKLLKWTLQRDILKTWSYADVLKYIEPAFWDSRTQVQKEDFAKTYLLIKENILKDPSNANENIGIELQWEKLIYHGHSIKFALNIKDINRMYIVWENLNWITVWDCPRTNSPKELLNAADAICWAIKTFQGKKKKEIDREPFEVNSLWEINPIWFDETIKEWVKSYFWFTSRQKRFKEANISKSTAWLVASFLNKLPSNQWYKTARDSHDKEIIIKVKSWEKNKWYLSIWHDWVELPEVYKSNFNGTDFYSLPKNNYDPTQLDAGARLWSIQKMIHGFENYVIDPTTWMIKATLWWVEVIVKDVWWVVKELVVKWGQWTADAVVKIWESEQFKSMISLWEKWLMYIVEVWWKLVLKGVWIIEELLIKHWEKIMKKFIEIIWGGLEQAKTEILQVAGYPSIEELLKAIGNGVDGVMDKILWETSNTNGYLWKFIEWITNWLWSIDLKSLATIFIWLLGYRAIK